MWTADAQKWKDKGVPSVHQWILLSTWDIAVMEKNHPSTQTLLANGTGSRLPDSSVSLYSLHGQKWEDISKSLKYHTLCLHINTFG